MILFVVTDVCAKDFIVVIDAGHGGKDSGALGKSTKEKDLNLAVALKLGKEIQSRYKDVKVVYTRSTDVFVTIKGRMDIAKAEKADLFISLHCNSAAFENPRRSQLSGTSVYVLGNNNANDNIDLAMRENSAILLEDDYKTTYKGFDNSPEYYIFTEINQSKMMGKSNSIANEVQRELVKHAGLKDNRVNETSRLWLLLHSTMPAILVEMDYICNPNREQFLDSENGQAKIAEAICNGIDNYRRSLGHKPQTKGMKSTSEPAPKADTTPAASPSADQTADTKVKIDDKTVVYKIQFLVSPRQLKAGSTQLKGITGAEFYIYGGSYKYTYGNYKSQAEASSDLKEIKKKFPDAFVIKMKGGVRIK
ncbi:MAG: N-acetylmuramoyl-L-alanine amidase [Bacteroides sp.]|nr:N-acetylmuramoyl-L-alanine amidase [Bacteroides sp.]MCM1413345.1 N-acetylmuramoyl-L-alanine amidase [Bacteroides sp.]MCM1471969.1 N-acetylmuramoyl-L-alanine amidase [Bacteroides sp.]